MIARLQQRKAEKERREKELLENETKRAQEIYVSLRKVREAIKKREEDEMEKENEAWRQQELKAQEEEKRRRSSVSLARKEVQREREEAKRLSMVEGPRRSFSVKPQRPPPPVPGRLVEADFRLPFFRNLHRHSHAQLQSSSISFTKHNTFRNLAFVEKVNN